MEGLGEWFERKKSDLLLLAMNPYTGDSVFTLLQPRYMGGCSGTPADDRPSLIHAVVLCRQT